MTGRRYTHKEMLRWRGIDTPCAKCEGSGRAWYPTTSTWRGGAGGEKPTPDVCDRCWGSGDAVRPWADLRNLESALHDAQQRRIVDGAAEKLAQRLGLAAPSHCAPYLRALADIADRESRRRKDPDGCDPFWWRRTLEAIASGLRTLADASEQDAR
jgi:hypothetical protein